MFTELRNDQSRQLIDATQVFELYRQARADLRRDFPGSMRWRKIAGSDYLIFGRNGQETSLGKRSGATEAKSNAFLEGRKQLKARRDSLAARLKVMRPINMGYRLGRVPDISARIIDALDRAGLLDGRVRIVGTTALYAYEARAGVRFDSGIVATEDLDLLFDAQLGLGLAAPGDIDIGGLLRRVDRSFRLDYSEIATNSDGFIVDLLRPDEHSEGLLAGPPFEAVAISERGNPVFLSVPSPSEMAKHKGWLSKESSRNPAKRRRDAAQSEAIDSLVTAYFRGA